MSFRYLEYNLEYKSTKSYIYDAQRLQRKFSFGGTYSFPRGLAFARHPGRVRKCRAETGNGNVRNEFTKLDDASNRYECFSSTDDWLSNTAAVDDVTKSDRICAAAKRPSARPNINLF